MKLFPVAHKQNYSPRIEITKIRRPLLWSWRVVFGKGTISAEAVSAYTIFEENLEDAKGFSRSLDTPLSIYYLGDLIVDGDWFIPFSDEERVTE